MIFATAIFISLMPGVLSWWWGRALVPQKEDAVLPERLLSFRKRRTQASTFAIAALLFLQTPAAVPLLFIVVAGVLVGSFPARRALFDEKWGLFSYLSFNFRIAAGFIGFLIALMFVPQVLLFAPEFWWAATAVAVVLMLWNLFHRNIVCALLHATPLARPDLDPLIAEITRRASAVPRKIYRAGPAGGVWVNAFAIPSISGSAVILSDSLLESFSAQEAAAVYAHEVAHIEHFSKKHRLLRTCIAGWVLIAVSILFSWFLLSQTESTAHLLIAFWSLLLFFATAVRMAKNKAHETESDRRAAELCGDAEAMARALEKLHVLNLIPRRWEPGMERCASHPSLAHRLQDLRKERPVAEPADRILVAGAASGGMVAIMDAERIHWLRGLPPDTAPDPALLREKASGIESVVYPEITDLRIIMKAGKNAMLAARDRQGGKWKVPLREDEVARVQAFLDTVDVHFARVQTNEGRMLSESVWSVLPALLMSFVSGVFACALLASSLIALIRPYAAPLAAFGVISLAAALIGLSQGGSGGFLDVYPQFPLFLMAVSGLICLVLAFMKAPADPEVRSRGSLISAAILGGIALLTGVFLILVAGLSPVHINHYAKIVSSFPLALLGTSASLLFMRRQHMGRAGASVLAALAILPILAGTPWFRARFSGDAFRSIPPAPRTISAVNPHIEWWGSFKNYGNGLRLSSTGSHAAARTFAPQGKKGARQFLLLSAKEPARQICAEEMEFLEDGSVLALSGEQNGCRLHRFAVDDMKKDIWSIDLPQLENPSLSVDPESGEWVILDVSTEGNDLIRLQGRTGGSKFENKRYAVHSPDDSRRTAYFYSYYATGESTLAAGLSDGLPVWAMWMGGSALAELEPEASRVIARSSSHVQWMTPRLRDRSIFGLVTENRQSSIWKVDTQSGISECILSLKELVHVNAEGANGLLGFVTESNETIVIDPKDGRAVRFSQARSDKTFRPRELAFAGNYIALLSLGSKESRVEVFKTNLPSETVRTAQNHQACWHDKPEGN